MVVQLRRLLLVELAFSLGCGLPALAQLVGAKLQGTVSDPSGAVLPNARITVTNVETGLPRVTSSNSEGFYTAPNLAEGIYNISAIAVVKEGVFLPLPPEFIREELKKLQ